MNASDVIRIGRSRMPRGLDRRVDDRHALRSRSCSANSTIRIAFFAARPISITSPIWQYTSLASPRSDTARQRAEHRQRHAQQDDERQHQALVLRRQRQVDEQQAEAEDQDRLLPGLDLLERQARPGVAHARRQRLLSRRAPSPAAPGPS